MQAGHDDMNRDSAGTVRRTYNRPGPQPKDREAPVLTARGVCAAAGSVDMASVTSASVPMTARQRA